MPCLNLSTNVSLDGVDTSAILSEATSTVAKIIGKPEAYVMIVLKGSVPIAFGGTEQPAAYGELVSIGGLGPDVNKKLSAAISAILETKLSVSKSRFFLKFYDTKASNLNLLREKSTKGQREFEIEADGHANLLAPRTYYLKLLVFTTCLKEVLRLSSMEKIINGNLTSSKILTDEQTNADIAVFGLSRLMTTAASTNIIATAGSLSAPELSKLKNASTKSDVYNLGVIILELLKSPGEPANGIGWHP
ncbi:hypothetical protein GH714_018295 [Hevea brasiliensis]|uniref:Protein kinase domain-containing protein n=1 Tax=Hevea brasiliensis TaxID=3981 RepID=A0A6A6M3D1_HEVBR|nr:hypothetical protein GH714_018295 [Hevea brasiliensis]